MSVVVVVAPLMTWPACKSELRLFGIEEESENRDLFTFECTACGRLEVRGVPVAAPFSS